MMTMMFIIGAVLATHPPTNLNTVSPASIAMVVMIYLYVIGYSASWGPIPWVCSPVLFTSSLGFAIAAGLWNLMCWMSENYTDKINRFT